MAKHELRLIPLEFSHLNDVFLLWSDWDAVKNTNWPYTRTIEECSERLQRCIGHYSRNPLHFGPYVIQLSNGHFAGIIGADAQPSVSGQFDVWYFLEKKQRGKGIAKEAVFALLNEMKDSGRVQEAIATAVVDNPASWGLLEKVGFKRDSMVPGGHQKDSLTLDLFEYSMKFNQS